jgi:hypothetical protein
MVAFDLTRTRAGIHRKAVAAEGLSVSSGWLGTPWESRIRYWLWISI